MGIREEQLPKHGGLKEATMTRRKSRTEKTMKKARNIDMKVMK